MALFEWVNEMSVNIADIDDQHKRLVAMINELVEAIEASERTATLNRILAEMVEYSMTHFALEEGYMIKHDYPGYAIHKKQHDAFVAKAKELQQRESRKTILIAMDTANFLMDWLRAHVMGTDKLYMPFLNSKGVY